MTSNRQVDYPSNFTLDLVGSSIGSKTNFTSDQKDQKKIPKSEVNDYNPFINRDVEHPITFIGALIHIIKGSLGTGILAIPSAFKYAGTLVGLLGTVCVGLLCTHTVHLLVSGSQRICRIIKKPELGFAETAEAVFKNGPKRLRPFATFAWYFVNFALCSTYLLCCAVFIVFIVTHVKEVIDFYFSEEKDLNHIYYMAPVMLLLMILCQVRHLKYIIPISFLANVNVVISFGITLYYMFSNVNELNIKDKPLAKPLSGIPLFFSTVLFAMEGIGTILPVENSLHEPERFLGCPGVLNISMGCIIVVYSVVGLFGYLKWGEDVQASIIKNLPHDEIVAQVAKVSIALAAFFTFVFIFYVPVDIIWRKIIANKIPEKFFNLAQITLRIVLVFLITVIAASVPDLATIIDLVGSIFFSTLGLLIPAVLDCVIEWENLGFFYWRLIKNIIIICLAFFAMISGVYYAISSHLK